MNGNYIPLDDVGKQWTGADADASALPDDGAAGEDGGSEDEESEEPKKDENI